MRAPGPLVAAGRDSEIFEYGPRHVLRRARGGRSLAAEARIMEHLRLQGYPVPGIEAISEDGRDLVMERIEGRSLASVMTRSPWSLRRLGAVLAQLHERLHDLEAPEFLPAVPVRDGSRVVHLDLHPLNVMVGPNGPVVIDWANAARGDPAFDEAVAWILMAGAKIPGRVTAALGGRLRSLAVEGFLGPFDRDAVVAAAGDAVRWKAGDRNLGPDEIEAMWRVVENADRRARP